MATTVDEYREAKQTYLRLREQAKKDLLAQFQQLANQLLDIQRELREDFGHKIAIPTKAKPKRPAKKSSGTAAASAPASKSASANSGKTSPQITALEKKLAAANAKLNQLAEAGKPTQATKDKIYEIEDELRLARGA